MLDCLWACEGGTFCRGTNIGKISQDNYGKVETCILTIVVDVKYFLCIQIGSQMCVSGWGLVYCTKAEFITEKLQLIHHRTVCCCFMHNEIICIFWCTFSVEYVCVKIYISRICCLNMFPLVHFWMNFTISFKYLLWMVHLWTLPNVLLYMKQFWMIINNEDIGLLQ